ncbi:MAG: hypothetical protein WC100_03465 [Sterolibacterium sp.]
MSAFIVENKHIDYLINAALNLERGPYAQQFSWLRKYRGAIDAAEAAKELDAIGQMLLNENWRSINARYREENAAPVYIFNENSYRHAVPDALQVLKSISCFEYQACESDDYEKTLTAQFCRELHNHYIPRLPGYDKAVWGAPK